VFEQMMDVLEKATGFETIVTVAQAEAILVKKNPLVDLVFFLVVGAPNIPINESGTCLSTMSANVDRVLKLYHTTLNDESALFSWDQFVTHFRACLLKQLVILICYDGLCRDMADSLRDVKDVYHAHFDRVNVRCARMLLSDFGWVKDML
jgi:hypothetical protein